MQASGSAPEAAADHLGHFALLCQGDAGFIAEADPFIQASAPGSR